MPGGSPPGYDAPTSDWTASGFESISSRQQVARVWLWALAQPAMNGSMSRWFRASPDTTISRNSQGPTEATPGLQGPGFRIRTPPSNTPATDIPIHPRHVGDRSMDCGGRMGCQPPRDPRLLDPSGISLPDPNEPPTPRRGAVCDCVADEASARLGSQADQGC